jgi:two-component system response regulator NreC
MSLISLAIYDEQKLVSEGIKSLLSDVEMIEVTLLSNSKPHLMESLRTKLAHILVINVHELNSTLINLIIQLNISFPKIKILIMSHNNSEDMILKTIKAGAKGYLAKESDKNELVEAILTLRNGFDYYSKSITHLLINKYITKIKTDDVGHKSDVESLSARQIEILKLWGENYSNKEIADKLFISIRTVETHKNQIMQKLNLKTTVDMVKFAIRNNLIEI